MSYLPIIPDFPIRKGSNCLFLLLISLNSILARPTLSAFTDSSQVPPIGVHLDQDASYQALVSRYEFERSSLRKKMNSVESKLHTGQLQKDALQLIQLLFEKERIIQAWWLLENDYQDKILQLRFKKSIEMLKLLYEKMLSMDHHFAGMKALNDISNLSNPQYYPAFREFQARMEEKARKKHLTPLSPLLQSNPYIAAAFTVFGFLYQSTNQPTETTEELQCILDFTVRMHQDLQNIYFELTFLKDANQLLLADCEQLFVECSKSVGYHLPLAYCREYDDWESLYQKVGAIPKDTSPSFPVSSLTSYSFPTMQKQQMALQFAIDRVTTFTERYIQFIQHGTEYYKKFSRILAAYHPDTTCAKVTPAAFLELKAEIQHALDKFKTAYQLPEIQGSKLKEMKYGVPEH